MIDFTSKTYRNLLRAQLDRVPDSLDKREGSLIQTAIGAGAYALEEFYLELDQVQRGAYLQTAVGQDLDYLAVLANVRRYPASAAVRLGVFNVDVPLGSRFSTNAALTTIIRVDINQTYHNFPKTLAISIWISYNTIDNLTDGSLCYRLRGRYNLRPIT